MRSSKWYSNPEMIVGLSALAASFIAVFVGVYSAYIDRAYARASVWPRLEISRSYTGEGQFSYSVSNKGTGPAVVRFATVSKGDTYFRRWSELLSDIAAEGGFAQSHIGTTVLAPQEVRAALSFNHPDMFSKLFAIDEQIQISICYCSIYDECWTTDRNNMPADVDGCPVDENIRFLQ